MQQDKNNRTYNKLNNKANKNTTGYYRKKRYGIIKGPKIFKTMVLASAICVCVLFVFLLVCSKISGNNQAEKPLAVSEEISDCPLEIRENYLTPNKYSRPQTAIDKIKGIVVHYTANPGTDALANRNYFNNLAITGETYASSHYIIDLDGSVIQCIPLNEISYASNDRNKDTISIECCHPDKSGKFTDATYDSLVKLVAWLSNTFDVDTEDIIRHYDITGKNCPKYYVKNEKKWKKFKEEVADERRSLQT